MTRVSFRTSKRDQLLDITDDVSAFVRNVSKGRDGAVLVYCPHTTAGVFVNEGADPDVGMDLLDCLSRLVPHEGRYRHVEGNAAAHIRAVLVGNSLFLPVLNGALHLGTWQRIFFAEFDGPRSRNVYLQFLAGNDNI